MKIKKILENIKKNIKIIKKNHLLVVFFIAYNLINATILRLVTVNTLTISPFLVDLSFLLIISEVALLFKRSRRINYFMIVTIILTIVCIINSIYYHYYSSFASFSLLATAAFAADVGDAIVEKVMQTIDFIYILSPICLYLSYRFLKKKRYFEKPVKQEQKKVAKKLSLSALGLFILGGIFMPINSWASLFKLWNREAVVMSYGIYFYQLDDFIQSLTPQINNLFGHDSALKTVSDYYTENQKESPPNQFTNIFKGKNVIVIHAESMQTFPMKLKFNGEEVTPNLNKLASEGIFFSNFYSQVGVGTSSDAEFTFNTSLMPSTRGTVFVNYFNRQYIALPKLLKEQGYYTYSMHANTGDFWNRNTMHQNLGYDQFYSKNSYVIDETIGLGLSDKSFFNQSVEIMKKVKETEEGPFYSLLITLTNHTPFSDLELIDEYPTTIDVKIENKTITREYLNNTTMGNYLRSVHYADEAIGEFIDKLDDEGLLENTVIMIYGDHDARISYNDFNLLYNYDPIEDRILTEEDENYVVYNKYTYELDRKVPFIIWTKDENFNLQVDLPMGMIDVLPTIGNMLGIKSDYQLGTDIFSIEEDNTVVFVDGSFLTSKVYYNGSKNEIYAINNEPINEDYIKEQAEKASKIIEISNDIISYDLIKELES